MRAAAIALIGLLTASTVRCVHAATPGDLDEATFAQWRAFILPDQRESAWTRIPWMPTFREGMQAADAEGKPLLLWMMNGHPLGCT